MSRRRALDSLVPAAVSHVAGPYLKTWDPGPPGEVSDLPVATGPGAKWQSFPKIPPQRRITLDDAASELLNLTRGAVAATIGTRPIAATLSSGMDSSSVVAVCATQGLDVVPITWSFPTVRSADETVWARQTADALGLSLVEVEISPKTLLPEEGITTRYESPLFNVFNGAWKATGAAVIDLGRDNLATGYPGDLLFSGWVTPTADLLVTLRWARLISYLRRSAESGARYRTMIRQEIAGPIARQMFPSWWVERRQPFIWLHPSRHKLWRTLQRREIEKGALPSLSERRTRVSGGSLSVLAENPVLSEMGITQIHPLLDASLLEFALSLPTWLLYDGGLDKLVLREAMRGFLPDDIIKLEKIMPSDVAVAALRARREPLMELTHNMKAADLEIIDEASLQADVHSFMLGEHTNMAFWNVLTLEDWLRRWW